MDTRQHDTQGRIIHGLIQCIKACSRNNQQGHLHES